MRDSIEDFRIANPKRGAKYRTPRLRFGLLAISGSSMWSGQDICRYLARDIGCVVGTAGAGKSFWGIGAVFL